MGEAHAGLPSACQTGCEGWRLPLRWTPHRPGTSADAPCLWKCLGFFAGLRSRRTRGEIISRKGPFGGRFIGCLGFFHRTLLPRTFIREPLAKILLHCLLNNFRQTFSRSVAPDQCSQGQREFKTPHPAPPRAAESCRLLCIGLANSIQVISPYGP